ncbi:MAG: diguanylate cyclase [Paracoccaceae bacterium]
MTGRILIVDNVATNRIILKVKLASASYEVWQAESTDSLLHIAETRKPDLILMDTNLRDSDSFETCRQLKQNPETSAIPVVMMTDNYNRDIRLKALRAGADDVLAKPLEEQVLLARVRNMLRAHGLEEELLRRQGTAADFGFHEPSSNFNTKAQVLLVSTNSKASYLWISDIRNKISAEVKIINQSRVLEQIGQAETSPDVIVLPAELDQETGCLTLIAELRSRSETRHSAIIVTRRSGDQDHSIASLDIGANDLLDENSHAEEVALRINTQLKRKIKADQLRATMEDGLRLAVTDPLTGLYNRRYALPHTARISAQSLERGNPFAVMVLDLDRFKRINDTYGHAAGDAVLKEIANRLKNNLRSVDLICRIGGEEFLVVMPDTDLQAARMTAERLRCVTEADPVTVSAEIGDIPVTLSIGVSIGGLQGQTEIPVQKVVDRADRALMGAKIHGRNQVTFGQTAA